MNKIQIKYISIVFNRRHCAEWISFDKPTRFVFQIDIDDFNSKLVSLNLLVLTNIYNCSILFNAVVSDKLKCQLDSTHLHSELLIIVFVIF